MSAKIKSGFLQVIRALKANGALTPIILAILIFNMLIAASVAWFTLNRQTSAGEMGMALAVDDTKATYTVYMFDLHKMEGTNTLADGSELTISNLDFNQYDTIFHMQNKYTPAIAKIQLTRVSTMPESGIVTLNLTRNDLEEEDGKLSMFSSSVIRFTAMIDSTKGDVALTDPDEIFRYINTDTRFDTVSGYVGNDYDNSKTFVGVIGEGAGHTHNKTDEITLAIPYTASDWYTDSTGADALNVYLYMTYDVQLIECFMEENTGGVISLVDNFYLFENDMNMITIGYEK